MSQYLEADAKEHNVWNSQDKIVTEISQEKVYNHRNHPKWNSEKETEKQLQENRASGTCEAISNCLTNCNWSFRELRKKGERILFEDISSVQSLSHVRLFATPWIAAHQASLSITNSQSSLRLSTIESMMPSSHLILCRPLLLLPPIPPSIRVFSHESTLLMRWPKYWSFIPTYLLKCVHVEKTYLINCLLEGRVIRTSIHCLCKRKKSIQLIWKIIW